MTLIELMLAIGIAAAVSVLLFSLYGTLSQSARSQQARRRGGAAVSHALSVMAHDAMISMPVYGHDKGGFSLFSEDSPRGRLSQWSFSVPRLDELPGDGSDLRWFRSVSVEYRLDSQPGQRGRLLQVERPLIGPDALLPARTNLMVEGIDQLYVQVLVGEDWVDSHQGEPQEWDQLQWPRAARIRLLADGQTRGQREHTVDVLIPSGWSFSPSN